MKEIVTWLRSIENLASDVYRAAALEMANDQQFSSFLSRMTEDEAWHYHLLGSAAQYLNETEEDLKSEVEIDLITKINVETPFQNLINRMAQQRITRQDVVDCIVKAEFSEMNHIFLYIFNTFRESSKTFQYAAASIQAHEDRINKFLKNLPGDIHVPDEVRNLPRIWEQKILIVEDDIPIRDLLTRVLSDVGAVHTAGNGGEAIDKVKNHFFNVVVSDIGMPVMDGIEFFQEAVELEPEIKRRFIFCSGEITPETESLCKRHDLTFFRKPVKLRQLKDAVQDIIDKTL